MKPARRVGFGWLLLLPVLLMTPASGFADNVVFGPVELVRATSLPTQHVYSIARDEPGDFYFLVVENGPGGTPRISSATIVLNDQVVVAPYEFSQTIASIRKRISLRTANQLVVTLASIPGARISVKILGPTAALVDPPVVTVDPAVVPSAPSIGGIDGGPARPLGRLLGASGHPFDFVENEVYVVSDDPAAVARFAERWNGQVNFTIDFAELGVTGQPSIYSVTVNPDPVDTGRLAEDLEQLDDRNHGPIRLSSENGRKLLALIAQEARRNGLNVGLNVILPSTDYLERTTREAPALVPVDEPDPRPAYSPDAFTWPYMNRGSEQDTGVAEAWRVLAAMGRIAPGVTVYVADAGFRPNADFHGSYFAMEGSLRVINPDPTNCHGGEGATSENCQWHGTQVVLAGMGRSDNGFGAAGPGGPVARPVLVLSPSPDTISIFRYIARAIVTVDRFGPGIVNISGGTPISAGLCVVACGAMDAAALSFRRAGMLLVAAAGNQGADIDATDEVCVVFGLTGCIPFEEDVYIPCEIDGVTCVGALGWNTNGRARFSNYGSDHDDCCTVDMFAPGVLWSVASPIEADAANDDPDGSVNLIQGTSFAAPFLSGVAALVWAANPSLDGAGVEAILRSTAHTGSDTALVVPRWVNALAAVRQALGTDTPPYVQIRQPADGATFSAGGESVSLSADVEDLEDGTPSVEWRSDRHAALIGTGILTSTTSLALGPHIITATAIDSFGNRMSDSVAITIRNDPPIVRITHHPSPCIQGTSIVWRGMGTDVNNPPDYQLRPDQLRWSVEPSLGGERVHIGNGNTLTIACRSLSLGGYWVYLEGTDGELTGWDNRFLEVIEAGSGNTAPSVGILRPDEGVSLLANGQDEGGWYKLVDVEWIASDPEDGELPLSQLSWQVSANTGPWEPLTLRPVGVFIGGVFTIVGYQAKVYAPEPYNTIRIRLIGTDNAGTPSIPDEVRFYLSVLF